MRGINTLLAQKIINGELPLGALAARGSTSAPFLSESSAFLSRCTRRASRRTRLTGPRVPCESSLKALYNQLANSKLVGWTLYHISNWQPHTCLNAVSVTNSKRLTTKLQRRIRKNSKYLILNPESNLGVNRRSLANQNAAPRLAGSVRSRSPASRSLARSAPFCISLHLSPRAQLSHATRIAPHPACALPRLAPRKCQLSLN